MREMIEVQGTKFLIGRWLVPALLATIVLGGAGGCAKTRPSRFYMLDPVSVSAIGPAGTERGIAIGVGPVSLPVYLDRPQIVMRSGGTELELGEFNRWAEPLQDNFTRVLAENLSVLLGTSRVSLYPWPMAAPVDYQITVEVGRFDASSDGSVLLRARWSIFRGESEEMLLMRTSRFADSAVPGDYEALVAAHSRTLGALSREIAAAIMSL